MPGQTLFAGGAVEARLAKLDPQAALDGFAARLEALQSRLSVLETSEENPFAEISEQLTRLYAQKDATVETVFARLAPLEAKLAEVEAMLAARDPRRRWTVRERLETLQGRLAGLEEARSRDLERLPALRLKDATVEAVFARLAAPLEAKPRARAGARRAGPAGGARPLRGTAGGGAGDASRRWRRTRAGPGDPGSCAERMPPSGRCSRGWAAERSRASAGGSCAQDPRAALDRHLGNRRCRDASRRWRRTVRRDARARPLAEGCHRQRPCSAAAPLEAKLAVGRGCTIRGANRSFAERLEAVQGRTEMLEGAGNPSGRSPVADAALTQKDATVETVSRG
jgi:hypothetical protein